MTRRAPDRWRTDDGIATVTACLALAALLAATLLIMHVGTVVVARHRAQSAADLSALAAAGALDAGAEAGCARAGELTRRMGGRVESCAVAEWDVTVTVTLTVSISPLGERTVRASARAGPVSETAPAE
ncbi:Rv3654c family TadE-like protein [Nocardia blacklockiae]|uniref:Rv3654c family TadE-like protein n=1 Tax=Nocardia blacklockiae TaxID=480036 RepID=UPI0018930DBE|nr:Rv3654c family TadE-like protein [Nocardia blacklockiae]MBF6173237.1 flp pilus-assembly TadE/G-like family protein [Nocardia blacklockiae]